MQKFVEKRSTENFDKVNDWYKKCQQEQIPYIVLTKRGKNADVQWDYIAFDKAVDQVLINNSEHILSSAKGILLQYAKSTSRYSMTCIIIEFKNLELGCARMAAADIYDLIVNVKQNH